MKILTNLGTHKKSLIIGGVVVILAGGGLFGFKEYDKKQHEIAIEELTSKESGMKTIQKELDSYLLKDGYISEKVTTESLEKNGDQLKVFKNFTQSNYVEDKEFKSFKKNVAELDKQISHITVKFGKQKQVNALFDNEVMVANEVKSDGIVKEDVQSVDIDISEFKSDGWLTAIQNQLKLAKDQIDKKVDASKSVESFFSQDKVKEGVTRKQYDESIKKIKLVKNKKVQAGLNDRIKIVDDELRRLDKLAKEKVEKEAKATGGTVEKKEDGSYVVVAPKQEVSNNSGSVALTGGTSGTQSYSGNEGSSYSAPATNSNSYSGGGSSNNYSGSSSSTGGSQSSGGGSVAPSNGGSSNAGSSGGTDNSDYWTYVGENPLTGGDGYIGKEVNSFDDIPGLEYVNGK